MKYLHEAVIIASITFAAEIIKFLLPLPVPASIYGLILLLLFMGFVGTVVVMMVTGMVSQALVRRGGEEKKA